MNYKFKCKHCGCDRIEEVLTGAVVYSEVETIKVVDDVFELEYGKCRHDFDGESEASVRYECRDCGIVLTVDELKALAK